MLLEMKPGDEAAWACRLEVHRLLQPPPPAQSSGEGATPGQGGIFPLAPPPPPRERGGPGSQQPLGCVSGGKFSTVCV